MKRLSIPFLTILVVAMASVLASTMKHHFTVLPVVHAQGGCSNATLSGNYGITFSGFQRQHNKSVPFYGAGIAIADGEGNLRSTFRFSLDGVPSRDQTYTATYTVNPDCTVLTTATPGSGGDNFFGVIVGGGSELLDTDISSPDTLNLDAKRQ